MALTNNKFVRIESGMLNPNAPISSEDIRLEFERRGITQEAAARDAKVSQATINRWIHGATPRGAYQDKARRWLAKSQKLPGLFKPAGAGLSTELQR